MSFSKQFTSEISEVLSTDKNKLNTAFDNGFYSKRKVLRRLEWWHCLSHKDLIRKSIKTNNSWHSFCSWVIVLRFFSEFLAKIRITTVLLQVLPVRRLLKKSI